METLNKKKSLADIVVQQNTYYRRAEVEQDAPSRLHLLNTQTSLREVASSLPHAMRYFYDAEIKKTIDRFRPIDAEEIIGQLANVNFPYDRMWLEGPTFLNTMRHNPILQVGKELTLDRLFQTPRTGLLILTNQKEHSFKFMLVTEQMLMDLRYATVQKMPSDEDPVLQNRTLPECAFNEFVTVSPSGIDFNEDLLLERLGLEQSYLNTEWKPLVGEGTSSDAAINDLYNAADFLARFFVVRNSPYAKDNLKEVEAFQKQDLTALNKKRAKQGKPPHLPLSPIKIDIAKVPGITADTRKPKQLRILLGYTTVSRSRDIVSKHGVVFHREPHHRRIPSPEDRRQVAHTVTSSQPTQLVIEDKRPKIVRVPPSQAPHNDRR